MGTLTVFMSGICVGVWLFVALHAFLSRHRRTYANHPNDREE